MILVIMILVLMTLVLMTFDQRLVQRNLASTNCPNDFTLITLVLMAFGLMFQLNGSHPWRISVRRIVEDVEPRRIRQIRCQD